MTAVLWVASFGALVLLPAYAATRWAVSQSRVDRIEQAAYAYGGIVLTCWPLWVTAQLGAGLPGAMLGGVLVAVALVALAPAGKGDQTDEVRDEDRRPRRAVWIGAVVMVAVVLVPFFPYGWDGADGIHRMSMSDWYKHLSVATALQAGAFPPANPFLHAVGPAPYYYGFHLLAVPFQHLGADPFAALLAWTLVTAAAFPLVVYLVAKGLFGDARCAAVAAVGASLLVGFDLVVWVAHAVEHTASRWPLEPGLAGLRQLVPFTHLDSWVEHNERQFNPPYVTAIWAPHHLAAVSMSLLVVHELRPGRAPSGRFPLLPVLLLAALPAMSAYVAVGFGAAVAMSVVAEGRWQPWRTEVWARWSSVALPAAVLAIPVIWGLSGGTGSGRLIVGVSSAGDLLNGAIFSAVWGDGAIPRLLDTPVLYLSELGIVGLLAAVGVRGRIRNGQVSAGQRQALLIAAAVLLLVTFVRPPVDGPNNLYARPMLIVWAILSGFAADTWVRMRPKPVWVSLVGGVCIIGTVMTIAGATIEGLLFGATSTETVHVARWINAHAADDAVVAFTPPNRRFGYWLRRRTVAADRRHALLFGAPEARYDEIVEELEDAYASRASAEAYRRFEALGAEVIVVDLPLPSWARSPCFDVGFRGSATAVVTLGRVVCDPPPR